MPVFNGEDLGLPLFFEWKGKSYDVARNGWIVVYDDESVADEIGTFYNCEVKHCPTTPEYRAKRNLCWETFSIVRFPESLTIQ